MKVPHNLSGMYFRAQNEETGKWESVCFEDLSEKQMDEQLNQRSEEWIKSLAKQLANKLHQIGVEFEIFAE